MDPNWLRWIIASVTQHFATSLTAAGLYLQVEGTDRRTDQIQDYAELRHDGPRFNELSKGYWRIDLDLDVLVCSKTNDLNIYTPEIDVGNVLAAFNDEIAVFKLGNKPQDDPNVQLGCLTLDNANGPIRVTNFGINREQVRLRQASVEATYRMYIST